MRAEHKTVRTFYYSQHVVGSLSGICIHSCPASLHQDTRHLMLKHKDVRESIGSGMCASRAGGLCAKCELRPELGRREAH